MNNHSNKFIEDFKKELTEVENEKYLIQNEIRQIDLYVSNTSFNKENPLNVNSNLGSNQFEKTNSVFDLSKNIFKKERFNTFFKCHILGKKYVPGKYESDDWYKEDIYIEANLFADYYNWLKELDVKPKTTKNKSKLTLNQKVLALHYLGLDLKKYDRTKSSNVLSQIIGEDESNTRKSLNYLNSATKEEKVKNIQNLKKLIELFKNEQFDKIKIKIKEDLEKVEVTD